MLLIRKKYINYVEEYFKNDNVLILSETRQRLIKDLIEKDIIKNEILLSGDDYVSEDYSNEKFLELIESKYDLKNKDCLIIDEAQKIKNIGIIIKYLVDKNKENNLGIKIIISGSGNLESFKGITDILVNNYDSIKLRPFYNRYDDI